MATSKNFRSSSNSDNCSICLESLTNEGANVYITICNHRFHFECIAQNIQAQNNDCPLCRTRLVSFGTALPTAPRAIITRRVQSSEVVPSNPSSDLFDTFPTLLNHTPSSNNTESTSSSTSSITPPVSEIVSNIPIDFSSPEDAIDEDALRRFSARITAARQQVIDGQHQIPSITVTTTLEFGGQESNEDSDMFGMITLKAPSLPSEWTAERERDELHIPVDLICVVDQSGSMRGEKITLLKQTLNHIIDQMGPLDRLAIVSFNMQAYNASNGLKLMTSEKKDTVRQTIRHNIEAGSGTYIGSGLEMAIQMLRARARTNPLGALLLLTDGEDNQVHDYSNLMRSLPDGVVCHTFGYGLDHDAGLLMVLAEQGHVGTFTFIDKADAIGPAFGMVLGGIFTCVAKSLRARLEFMNDYRILHMQTSYQYRPSILPSNEVIIKMTDLNADESRNIVFQIHVPKVRSSRDNAENNHIIGHASLEYIDANTNQMITIASVPFTLERPNKISSHSLLLQTNYVLDVQRNRAETVLVLKTVVDEPNYERARDILIDQSRRIQSSISAQHPLCQQLIRDLQHQYSTHEEFQINMTNIYVQHGQERATYATSAASSVVGYRTIGQERFRHRFS